MRNTMPPNTAVPSHNQNDILQTIQASANVMVARAGHGCGGATRV
jgi:hypothetical protein